MADSNGNAAANHRIPLSALQHYVFCPRQCALIHLERIWEENRLTAEGRVLHERADEGGLERKYDTLIVRSMPLYSEPHGLFGIADVVELDGADDQGRNPRSILPVEYKRGKKKPHNADRVQLCAQALCLEEMFNLTITEGALFYGKEHRREQVPLTPALRTETLDAAQAVRALMNSSTLPPPNKGPHCASCSIKDACRPALANGASAQAWLENAIAEELERSG